MQRILLLIGCMLAAWLPTAEAGDALQLQAARETPRFLGPHLEYWVDPQGDATIEGVLQGASFKEVNQRAVSLGLITEPVWYRFSISNRLPTEQTRLLYIGWASKQIELYAQQADGAWASVPTERPEYWRRTFRLDLPPGHTQTYLARSQTNHLDGQLLPFELYPPAEYNQMDFRFHILSAAYYGALAVMALYNLFLYFNLRERAYLLYVAVVVSVGWYLLGMDSLGTELFWAHSSNTLFAYRGAALLTGFTFLFANELLSVRSVWPRWGRLFDLLGGFALCLFAATWFFDLNPLLAIGYVYGGLMPLLLLSTGLAAIPRLGRIAVFYVVGWSTYLLALSGNLMYVAGLNWTDWSYEQTNLLVKLGSILEVALFSFALANRIHQLRQEKLAYQRQLVATAESQAKLMEQKVTERTAELALANETKDRFFSIIAHDLRGPVSSMAVILNEVIPDQGQIPQDLLQSLRLTSRNTQRFLEELLLWAKSQKGELEYHPRSLELASQVRDVMHLMSTQAQRKGINLSAHCPEGAKAFADQWMLSTVLRNLLHNALKFTEPGGSVSLEVRTEADALRLEVRDTGVGIAPEPLQNLLKLDGRQTAVQSRGPDGCNGLGLVLAQEFVQRNRGEFGATSQLGQGSCFWFTLPLPPAEPGKGLGPDVLRRLSVLLAEDDELHRQTSGKVLDDLKLRYEVVGNGVEALRRQEQVRFDLILMDVDMPQLDGPTAANFISQLPGKRPWVVALTSHARQDFEPPEQPTFFDGYLSKPLNAQDLLACLGPLCELNRAKPETG